MGDTTRHADDLRISILRHLTGEQRLQIALEMSDLARELCLAGLRSRHPDWSDSELKREFIRRMIAPVTLPRSSP